MKSKRGFRASFLKRSVDARYKLVSAVRGPDQTVCRVEVLKSIITARIRAIVFHEASGSLYNSSPLTNEGLEQVRTIMSSLKQNDHYINHLREAVEVTLDNKLWGGRGRTLHSILRG